MGRYGNYFGSYTPRVKNIIERGFLWKWMRQSRHFDFEDANTAETESVKTSQKEGKKTVEMLKVSYSVEKTLKHILKQTMQT